MSHFCPTKFYCKYCDYFTSYSKDYNKHLLTKKHNNNANNGFDNAFVLNKKTYTCENCDKIFVDRAGLWRHKKRCELHEKYNINNVIEKSKINGMDKDELIIMLLKQNAELIKGQQDIMKGQQDLTMEIVKNGTHNTTNNNNNTTTTTTNSHNKAFNLNFFLNETCKNAMNITEFVDSIKLQLSDFMNVGEAGFVQGISNIIVKKLNDLDETVRPIHCTDQKRETFYVKDENKWEKEEEDLKRIRKMIKRIAMKNEKLMFSYKEKYPDYSDYDSKRSDQYSKFVIEAMGGEGDNGKEKENKIIKHITKATAIKNK